MKRLLDDPNMLEALLLPETALERQLLQEPEFRHGLLWGEPRFGHPEGKVGLHVREVLDNIERIPALFPQQRAQLRLIAFAHDTFKYAEDRSRPRDWSKHHGRLARRYLEAYTADPAVLDIIETHDDAYYAWLDARHEDSQLKTARTISINQPATVDATMGGSEENLISLSLSITAAKMTEGELTSFALRASAGKLEALFARVGYCLQLYYLFFKCDTQTGDKTQAPLKWFEKNVPGLNIVKIAEL